MIKKTIVNVILCLTFLCSFPFAYAEDSFSTSVSLSDTRLTVSGSGIRSLRKIVTIKIDGPSEAIFHINQIKAQEDGTFSYSLTFADTDETGSYTVTVRTPEYAGEQRNTVYYVNAETKASVAADVNGALSTSAEETVLTLSRYRAHLGLEAYTQEELENAAFVLDLLKNGESYDFDTITYLCRRAGAVFDSISQSSESSLTGVLTANGDLLFENADIYEIYDGFSSSNKQIVNRLILENLPYEGYRDLREHITTFTNQVAASIEKKVLNLEAELAVDVINLSGSGTLTAKKIVTVKITNPNGEISNINQITANADGSFAYCVTLAEDEPDGYYKAEAFSRGMDEISVISDNENLYYISQTTRDKITGEINSAEATVSGIKQMLAENAIALSVDDMTEGGLETAAVVLLEQRPGDGYEYTGILAEISKSRELMGKLNKVTWTSLDALIADENAILLNGVNEYTQYQAYSSANRNKICKAVLEAAPFESIMEFRLSFAAALNSFADSPGSSSGSGGGGGGGGGSSASSGGSGSSSAISAVSQYTPSTVQTQPQEFSDLGGYEWAKGSIENLLKKGVVSYAADGRFRPADRITREEFIKLLVCAFELVDGEARCSFEDVPGDSWYYIYVASAYKNGITQGIDAARFGAGTDIKRQEMAALVYRTIQLLGAELKEDGAKKDFNDGAQIAEYAKEAVDSLQKAGIMNGDDTGSFRPEDSATRAEAAKVIDLLLLSLGR